VANPPRGFMRNHLILIIEDNDKNLKLARDVLRFEGYQTIEAKNGEDGVHLASLRKPDLVLMDICLPGIDGIAAFKSLRADSKTASIPVIALTASAMPDDWQRVMEAGFNGYLSKPISVKGFLVQVRSVLEKHSIP